MAIYIIHHHDRHDRRNCYRCHYSDHDLHHRDDDDNLLTRTLRREEREGRRLVCGISLGDPEYDSHDLDDFDDDDDSGDDDDGCAVPVVATLRMIWMKSMILMMLPMTMMTLTMLLRKGGGRFCREVVRRVRATTLAGMSSLVIFCDDEHVDDGASDVKDGPGAP